MKHGWRISTSNIHAPFANVLLDFAIYRAICEATIGEASSYSTDLSYIHLETLVEAIYRS